MNDASTSGPIEERFLSADDSRSTYEPLPSHGFNQLVKVRRQGRWFMLKGLKEEFRAQAIYRELLKKEYAMMAGLDHPCIIKAFAKEINEELGPCIVMEYVDGMPLNDFLATRPTTAMAGVELPDDSFVGDSRIGLCWGPLHFPTTQGRHAELDLSKEQGCIMLTGLAPGSTYFVRAYIETAAGTSYGNEISFTTAADVTAFPEGTVPGWFSVGEGKQVYFSQGNLQYQASTQTWRFAPHPYDYTGKDNMNLSPTWSGWIDLFGWGTSGFDHGAVNYQPWSENKVVQSNDLHQAYGDPACNLYDRDGRADWGYNRIANGGNAEHRWRTPKVSEWVYLLFIRDTASGIRYAKARVGDVNGLVLLPDNWSGSVWPLNAVNRTDVSFDVNRISVSDWTACLEKAGAAFLPESGARTVSGVFLRMAGYHSSDAAAGDAWHLTMDQHGLFLDANGHRGDGLAVRLVQDAD